MIAALFKAAFIALYRIEVNTVFMIHAGRTTVKSNRFNFVGSPTVIKTRNKNVVPLMAVPKAEVKIVVTWLFNLFLSGFNNINRIFVVIILSIKFGSCPPGNVVVPADSIPSTIPAVMHVFIIIIEQYYNK